MRKSFTRDIFQSNLTDCETFTCRVQRIYHVRSKLSSEESQPVGTGEWRSPNQSAAWMNARGAVRQQLARWKERKMLENMAGRQALRLRKSNANQRAAVALVTPANAASPGAVVGAALWDEWMTSLGWSAGHQVAQPVQFAAAISRLTCATTGHFPS
jgi:hypothetical protein